MPGSHNYYYKSHVAIIYFFGCVEEISSTHNWLKDFIMGECCLYYVSWNVFSVSISLMLNIYLQMLKHSGLAQINAALCDQSL